MITISVVAYLKITDVWNNPREGSYYISKIILPDNAQLLAEEGDSTDHYYIWKVSPGFLRSLQPPSGVKPPFNPHGNTSASWAEFGLGGFGVLDAQEVPKDGEALYYRTPFWSVLLIRSFKTSTLTIGGIYIN